MARYGFFTLLTALFLVGCVTEVGLSERGRYTDLRTGTVPPVYADDYLDEPQYELELTTQGLPLSIERFEPRTLTVTLESGELLEVSLNRVARTLERYWQTTVQITGTLDRDRGAYWVADQLRRRNVPPSRIRVEQTDPERALTLHIRPITEPTLGSADSPRS